MADSLFSRTLKLATAWLKQYGLYMSALIGVVAAYESYFSKLSGESKGLLVAGSLAPVLVALFGQTLPEHLRRRRVKRLKVRAKEDYVPPPKGYFRLTPYEEGDKGFTRADNAHIEVERWLRETDAPLLYLTGRSGSGKSSLLNAWVIPRLKEDSPRYKVVRVRGFHDPVQELCEGLGGSGSASDDAEALVRAAAEKLDSEERLLIVFDQFEELLILERSEEKERFRGLLKALLEEPPDRTKVVLVYRSDYDVEVNKLGLPPATSGHNWEKVGPFNLSAAREFLCGGPVELGDEQLESILSEAQEIEETRGLIRPVTLNMFGLVLERYEGGELPKDMEPGKLLRSYLNDTISGGEARDVARTVLRGLISDAGTKHPKSETQLAEDSGLDESVVRGSLNALAKRGLVRLVDRSRRIWEVSHDFLAALLNRLVNRPARAISRPSMAVILTLWAITVIFFVLPQQNRERGRNLLGEFGCVIAQSSVNCEEKLGPDDLGALREALLVVNPKGLNLSSTWVSDLEPLKGLVGLQTLDLSGSQVSDLEPLKGLKGLQTLDLGYSQVSDLKPLKGLLGLRMLDLGPTQVSDLEPLRGLTGLETLELWSNRRVSDLAPLKGLVGLQTLNLAHTRVSDLEPLKGLVGLQTLDLSRCSRVSDLAPLKGLVGLQTLDLSGSGVSDLEPLRKVVGLQTLDLYGTKVSDLEPLKGLKGLRTLTVGYTPVSDEEVRELQEALPDLAIVR